MNVFSDYKDAYKEAQIYANRLMRPMAIEKATEYGRVVFRVKMLPIKPSDRFGWETRCEVVDPDSNTQRYKRSITS